MEKTEALLRLEFFGYNRLPCSFTDWERAVIENPNFMQKDYDHLVKFSAIPQEVHDQHLKELQQALEPLEAEMAHIAPSKGILYMVQHPEYQAEWDANWRKSEEKRKTQFAERLKIHQRLHQKFYHEYGIRFNAKLVY